MKKATSLFLSIVMLISIISSVNLSALAQEVESFTYTPSTPFEIIEGTHGWFEDCENQRYYYAPDHNDGDTVSVTFNDIGTVDYVYNLENGSFLNDSGEEINVFAHSFAFNSTGETTFEVELVDYGKRTDVPVTIIENPVSSFTFTPVESYEIYENTNGRWSDDVWYYSPPSFNYGDRITVEYNNGPAVAYYFDSESEAFYNQSGESIDVDCYDFTFDGTGEATFMVELADYGKTTNVPVTIIENPVSSFTYTPVKACEVYENTNGWYDDWEDVYNYNPPDFNEGDKISVTFKNIGTVDYVFSMKKNGFFNENGEELYVRTWGFGFNGTGETTFEVELVDYGKRTDVPVTIIENPVVSFTYTPITPFTIIEGTHGWFDDNENQWCYDAPYYQDGDIISVTFNDIGKVDYTYKDDMAGFFNENGEELNVCTWRFSFNGAGETTFEVELVDYGKRIDVPVTIIENPVVSFTYTPITPFTIIEGAHAWFDDNENQWFYDAPDYQNGDIISVTFNDIGKVDYTYKDDMAGFFNENGEELNVCTWRFSFNGAGETTFEVELDDYGKRTDVPVTIIENPLRDFVYTPISPIVLSQTQDGEYDEEEETYWYYYEPQDGDKIELFFKDNSSEIYIFDSKTGGEYYYEGGFFNSNGEELCACPWGLSFKGTGKTTFEVELVDYGMKRSVPVTIVSDVKPTPPAKVTGLKTSARGANGVNLTLSWNAVDGATGYNVYGYNKPADSWTLLDTVTTNKYISPTTPGYEYYFRVAAVNGSVEGTPSDALHTCAACETMDAPSVIASNDKTIQVDWNLVGSHGYVVMWSKDASFKTGVSSKYITGHSKSNYTISVPSGASQYYVRVRAWRNWETGYVYGSWSEGVKAGQTIAKVTGLKTSARGANGVNLTISWNAQAAADSYNVYGYNKANDSWTLLGNVTTNKYIGATTPGYEYIYRVAAVEDGREGVPSERLHTCAACETMKAPTVQKNGSQIKVNWEIVGSHGYVVMWSTDPTFKTGVSSKYITGHSVNNYTITGINSNQTYYVRVRAWRNWDTGYVYGSWSTGTAAK